MIEEDLLASNLAKMELIYQREEIEQYIEKTKIENPDLKFISNLLTINEFKEHQQQWESIF